MIYLVTENRELFSNEAYKTIGVDESLSLLEPLKEVGLDTETSSLDCHTGKLLSLQLGCHNFQTVIDCSTVDVLRYKEFLESDRLFIGWNLKFDLKWLYTKGIIPRKVWDGFLAEKLMWLGYPSGMHSMSLQAAGENYLGVKLDKSVRGQIIYRGLNTDTIVYAAEDVKYLELIKEKQEAQLKEQNLLTALDYENRFVLALAYEEFCGVRIDTDKWKAKMQKDNEKLENAKKALDNWLMEHEPDSEYITVNYQGDLFSGFDLTPKVTLNWNSAKQVIPIFKKYGIEVAVEDKEKGGQKDSVDAKVLKPQKAKCSLIPLYIEYKEALKVTSTYGENVLRQINPDTGRLYTSFNQLGADTTRITSGGKDKAGKVEYINLLNMPADAETRACFTAERGNKWISLDYVGQETYLLASIANDQAIIRELTEGSGDIHSLTAYMSYKEIPRDTPIKDIKRLYHSLRQEAKGIEFAINYGGTANTIAANKGIPLEEATKIYNDYMSGFKGVKKYQDFCRRDVMEKGYILLNPLTGHKAYIYDFEDLQKDKEWLKTLDWEYYRQMKKEDPSCYTVERVRHFFKRRSACEKQSINYRIQGTGSMCLRVTLVNFFNWIVDNGLFDIVKITITPYDEVNCEAPVEIAGEVAAKLHEIMKKAGAYFCTRCKLDADISRLPNGSLPDYWIH